MWVVVVGGAVERRERGRRRSIGLAPHGLAPGAAGRFGPALASREGVPQALRDGCGFAPGAGAAFLLSGSGVLSSFRIRVRGSGFGSDSYLF